MSDRIPFVSVVGAHEQQRYGPLRRKRIPLEPPLLIWTENYWIGGCERFLADFVDGLEAVQAKVVLAGNPHPEFDRWLATRTPSALPRRVIPIANLVETPLRQLDGLRPPRTSNHAVETPDTLPRSDKRAAHDRAWSAGVAATRYAQASVNFVRLRSLFSELRPGVLLVNNGGYPGGESCRLAILAARAAGVPRIVHFVHNMAYPPAWPQPVERWLDRRINHATDAWVTAADRASDELSAQRQISREKIVTVHYGVDPAVPRDRPLSDTRRGELGIRDDVFNLVVVANMEPRKGLNVLLNALAVCERNGSPIHTTFVGDGEMYDRLRTEADALGLEQSVTFVGHQTDVDDILSVVDGLVLPSLSHECLPYVILEAMSHTLPVVATNVAGIPEMVLNGVSGWLVPPGDATALAAALAKLSANPEQARDMGEQGLAILATRFSRAAMMEAMRDLLQPQTSR